MTWRGAAIGVGGILLATAALVVGLKLLGMIRGTRRGQPQHWADLVSRVLLIAELAAIGGGILRTPNSTPAHMINQPAPAAASDIVAFVKPNGVANQDTLLGISARTGQIRWTRTLNYNVDTLKRPVSNIILASAHTDIYAFRAADGVLLWRYPAVTSRTTGDMVTVDGGQVFVLASLDSNEFSIVALDLRTGCLNWRASESMDTLNPDMLTAGDGQVYIEGDAVTDPSQPNRWRLTALGEANGALKWTMSSALNLRRIHSLFSVQGNVIAVPYDGQVVAIHARDGLIAWHATLDLGAGDIVAATTDGERVYALTEPPISDQTVYTANETISPPATLMALDANSGALRWRLSVSPYSAWNTLVASDGVLIRGVGMLGTHANLAFKQNGSLLTAYDASSGGALWRDNTPPTGVSWDLPLQLAPQSALGVVYLEGIEQDQYIQDNLLCPFIYCPGFSSLYAINIHSGAPWWRVSTGKVAIAQMIL